jgi:hypothetical protein
MMYGHEKSDLAIVAVKPTNKAERSAAELVERRAGAEGNAGQLSTRRAWHRTLARLRQLIAVDTRGGSRMRESRLYGSVRGARGNSRPYREVWSVCCTSSGVFSDSTEPRHPGRRSFVRMSGRKEQREEDLALTTARGLLRQR